MEQQSEYPGVEGYIPRLVDSIIRQKPVGMLRYDSIALTTPEPDFVDGYDPHVLLDPLLMAAYWPGGSPTHGYEFEIYSLDFNSERPPLTAADMAARKVLAHRALANAVVSADGLERIPPPRAEARRQLDAGTGSGVLAAREMCELEHAPFGMCQVSEVLRSRTLSVGAHMAHLWFPSIVSPKPVLAHVKKMARKAKDEEFFGWLTPPGA